MKIEYKNPKKKHGILVWEADVNFLSKEKDFNLRGMGELEMKKMAGKLYGEDALFFTPSVRAESFFLWVSKMKEWESQKNVKAQYSLDTRKEYEDKDNGNLIGIYDFSKNILGTKRLKINFSLESYEVELESENWDTKEYKRSSPFYIRYTRSERYIGQTDDIVKVAREVTREGGGYLAKAKMVYNWVTKNVTHENTSSRRSAKMIFESKKGNTIEINFLFIALLRAVDIPARLVSGSFGELEKTQEFHFWTEFYIEEVGWVPVDCVKKMFAKMDNKRIVFSKGENIVLEMSPENDNFFNISYKRVFFMQPEAIYISKKEEGLFAVRENKHLLVKEQKEE